MKIAVIGPGAMGCLFAAYLTEGGLDVTLVDCLPERAKELTSQGIRIHGVRGEHRVGVKITTDAGSVGHVDLVMVWVKAYQTEQALRQHRILVGDDSVVWTAQNGVGNTDAIARVIPASRVVGGSTTLGANLTEDGNVHHAGEGDTFIGELDGSTSDRVERIAARLTGAGIEVKSSPDIQRVIWNKLLVNVGINALTAILRVKNGVLLEHAAPLALMEAAVDEALRAAGERGFHFERTAVIRRVKEVARLTGQNRSSMLQDILAGERTEIEFINGAVARMGQAPVNQTLTRIVQAIEVTAGDNPWDMKK